MDLVVKRTGTVVEIAPDIMGLRYRLAPEEVPPNCGPEVHVTKMCGFIDPALVGRTVTITINIEIET